MLMDILQAVDFSNIRLNHSAEYGPRTHCGITVTLEGVSSVANFITAYEMSQFLSVYVFFVR